MSTMLDSAAANTKDKVAVGGVIPQAAGAPPPTSDAVSAAITTLSGSYLAKGGFGKFQRENIANISGWLLSCLLEMNWDDCRGRCCSSLRCALGVHCTGHAGDLRGAIARSECGVC